MKILFPFYNRTKHGFLLGKWWFRILIVVYIGISILSIGSIWNSRVNYIHYQCLEAIKYPSIPDEYNGNFKSYFGSPESKNAQSGVERSKQACNKVAQKAWFSVNVLREAIFIPLIVHYIIQFFFFKIIIDFIVLGGGIRKKSEL
ncbi:MAG: hypothetical protein AAB922_01920 [Patescibacteria group bacterium]